MHYALHILIKHMTNLEGSCLVSIQEEIRRVKNFLINEMSLIGRNILTQIDAQLHLPFLENYMFLLEGDQLYWSMIYENFL